MHEYVDMKKETYDKMISELKNKKADLEKELTGFKNARDSNLGYMGSYMKRHVEYDADIYKIRVSIHQLDKLIESKEDEEDEE